MSQVNIQGGTIKGVDNFETVQGGHAHFRGRVTGKNAIPKRYELEWVPGVYGIPSANADILSSTEATNITCDRNFEIVGTNATTDDALIYAEGGIVLATSGADGDSCVLAPHLDANQTAWTSVTWGTDEEVEWECWIETGPAITTSVVWAGLKLTNTSVTATDANQIFFRYENDVNSGKWQTVYSIADSDTSADTGLAVVLATQYHLKIVIGADRIAKMYINDVLYTTTSALTTNIDLIPYIGVEEDGASSAMYLRIYGQSISRVAGV